MKRNWKRVLAALLALVFAVSLAACKSNGSSNEGDKKQSITIGVWGGNESEEKALSTLVANFEKETGAKVEIKVYTDYNTQIQADMAGKTAPDAFYVDSSMYPFFDKQGVLAELTSADGYNASDFYSNLAKAFSTDGKLKAAPKDFSVLSLYINNEMFEKTGVDINSIPASYEDFVAWLPTFQAKLDEAYGKGQVYAMTYTPELSRSYHLAARGGAQPIKDDGLANLSDPKVVENLSILKQFVDTNAVTTPADAGFGWNGEIFGSGKAAIIDEGNWVYETLKTEYSKVNFTVKEMPTYKNEKGTMMFAVGWGKYIGTKNSALTDKWIQYVTGKDGMQIWCEATGTLPSRNDVAENSSKISSNSDFKILLSEVEYATPWQKGVSLDTINKAYVNYWAKAMDGSETLEKVMQNVDKEANDQINASK